MITTSCAAFVTASIVKNCSNSHTNVMPCLKIGDSILSDIARVHTTDVIQIKLIHMTLYIPLSYKEYSRPVRVCPVLEVYMKTTCTSSGHDKNICEVSKGSA